MRSEAELFPGAAADGPAPEGPPAPAPAPVVEIRASARRRKTVAAHWEGDAIVVVVPQRLSKRDRQACADDLVARLLASRARQRPTDEGLTARAAAVSRRYLRGLAPPASVTWTSRQQRRWGSCSPDDRTIRISDRLRDVPPWVLDVVLLHELVHLVHPDHGPAFRELADGHPRAAEAEQFLAGYALGLARSRPSTG
ncbi:MAG: M48 family metallopeptidase [Acidimicrobiia bacterium]